MDDRGIPWAYMQISLQELEKYQRVIQLSDPRSGLLAYVSVHKLLRKKPSFGATRFAVYDSNELALLDALKLSRLMTYKSVMAGLPYGGAKAVIVAKEGMKSAERNAILRSYARFVDKLQHEFITGADIGVSQRDVALMKKSAPHNMVGTKLDPVAYTIDGILLALAETIKLHMGKNSPEGFSFAVQGAGKIGETLIQSLYPYASKLFVTDISKEKLKEVKKKFPKIEVVDPSDIYTTGADFFSPCAVSHSLNKKTITKLNARVVLGGANIQLENEQAGELLHTKGILYVPDYVVNAGGLISVTDEYEHGVVSHKRIVKKLNIIPRRVRAILREAKVTGASTSSISDKMAEKIIEKLSSNAG